jgi:hypothetical protein
LTKLTLNSSAGQRRVADTVVMGAAIGLTRDQVRPFLISLNNSGYRGQTVLFVHRALADELRHDPAATQVTLVRVTQWLPFKLRLTERPRVLRLLWRLFQRTLFAALKSLQRVSVGGELALRLRDALARVIYPPMDSRFLLYSRYLRLNPHSHALLTDVRDVLFQNDPFAHLPATGLAVSLETDGYTVASEPHNAEWVARAYGPDMLARIGAHRVSCVGVTSGDREAILRYLSLFSDQLLALSPREAGVAGADTAIHNVLLRTGRLGPVHELEPLASPVATLNEIEESALSLGPTGLLLNRDGGEVSVLHQYDRLPGLRARLLQTLASEGTPVRRADGQPNDLGGDR